MSIVGIGIIGKQNEPIYTMTGTATLGDDSDGSRSSPPSSSSSITEMESERLHLESILFTSLDVIEVVNENICLLHHLSASTIASKMLSSNINRRKGEKKVKRHHMAEITFWDSFF